MAFELAMKTAQGADISYHNFPQLVVDKDCQTITVVRKSYISKAAREAGAEPVESKQECVIGFPGETDLTGVVETEGCDLLFAFVYETLKTQAKWSESVDC